MTARCHQHKERRSPVDVLAAEVRLLVGRWQLATAIGREVEECDNNVLTAYGRCLRPALYSSLRSSPSHPTGVSALRVTIAIASARKQWGLASQLPGRGTPFAMSRPPEDMFGQALLEKLVQ